MWFAERVASGWPVASCPADGGGPPAVVPGPEGDKTLRDIAEGDAREQLQRIKATVCD